MSDEIIKILQEIQSEQKDQRKLIDHLQKSIKNSGGISNTRIIFYLVFGLFAAGSMYYYYSTMVSMFQ